MIADLPVLMAVRVHGIASTAQLVTALGTDEKDIALDGFVDNGLLKGRTAGYALTADGHAALLALIDEEGLRASVEFVESFERFKPVDVGVKKATTAWQLGDKHAAVDSLFGLHDRAKACLRKVVACAPRYSGYVRRLDVCIERLASGDEKAFMDKANECYHNVWWALHTDLLLTLGRERED